MRIDKLCVEYFYWSTNRRRLFLTNVMLTLGLNSMIVGALTLVMATLLESKLVLVLGWLIAGVMFLISMFIAIWGEWLVNRNVFDKEWKKAWKSEEDYKEWLRRTRPWED